MASFEELNLGPEVVEALAAEGIETPTPFQAGAIPVIARGNDLLGRAGPGAGTLVGYAAPLLGRLTGGEGTPVCLVLCTGQRQATELARSLAPLADATGHRAAALTGQWNQPQLADFLFVPSEAISALYDGTVSLERVQAIVFHDGDGVVEITSADQLETVFKELPPDTQRVICGQPFGSALKAFADVHTRRAATVPPVPAEKSGSRQSRGAKRILQLEVVAQNRMESVLDVVVRLFEEDVRHVLIYTSSTDQAADVGDFLGLHGFHCGQPGDEAVPVWLAEEGADLPSQSNSVATVSFAVPPAAAAMAARHESGGPAVVLAEIRELGHVKEAAAQAGFQAKRSRPERPTRVSARIDELADQLGGLVTSTHLTPYYLLVESLIPRFTAAEVAAAALYLLSEKSAKERPSARQAEAPAWVRLFVTAGERDDIGTGDLLGAVTSGSGVAGGRVGRIDVRESHSLVEVRKEDSQKIIDALNGTTLGGRAIRVDFDRGKEQRTPPRGGRGKAPARPRS
ncbi:MAG: DbpA RNA binding domain-containing protein [Longimicrobiales bacterium]